MPNSKNLKQVDILKEKLANAKSVAVVDYQGTNVNDQVELRAALKEVGGEMFVAKNNLIDIAAGRGRLKDSLSGMTALIFSNDDAVSAIKSLFKFHQDSDKLEIKQGLYEDRVISFEELEQLSKLPSKDELIATLISRLNGPGYGLANVLKAGQRNLVYALKAIADKDQAAA